MRLYNLYSSPNYSGDHIKKLEMEWAYNMYGEEGKCVQVLVEKLEENNHLKNLNIDGRIILILIFKELNLQEVEWEVMDWIEHSGWGQVGGSCECGNKLLRKCWAFLD